MNILIGETLGSALLIVFGNGVVANVVLDKSKGHQGGWMVITMGWAMAVFIAVYCVAGFSGAHLNPAVSLAMAIIGKLSWAMLPLYIGAQLVGCLLGAILVWMIYKDHFTATEDPASIQACFCTKPAIQNYGQNFITEALATLVFVLGVLLLTKSDQGLGSLDALPVALLVLGVGLSLGGPTGYAINPARDLGPRIAHALLPLSNKGGNDWPYAWVPIAGPLAGAIGGSLIYQLII
jgi:glycerol uptake facilitator protein